MSVGTGGTGAGGSGSGLAFGQPTHSGSTLDASATAWSNGPSCARGIARTALNAFATRVDWLSRASTAGRTPRTSWSRTAPARCCRRPGRRRRFSRRRIGRTSPRSAPRTAPGRSERSVGSKSPAKRMSMRSSGPSVRCTIAPPDVVTGSAQRPALDAPHERGEVAARVARDAAAARRAAELAQDRADRLERRAPEDVGALGQHDRVEDERLDVGRVARRVGLGDLRAVRRAVEDELGVAALAPDRLDVLDGLGRAVEAAGGADLVRARPRRLADRSRRDHERAAAQLARLAGAALVEHDEVARGERRGDVRREALDERDRRLPGAAGQADDRRVRRVRRRDAALDAQRQRAGGGAGRVDRDGEVAALVAGRSARRPGDRRARGGRGGAAPARRTAGPASRCRARMGGARRRECRAARGRVH